MTESGRRRRRPAVSCFLCRKRKIKCNRETPCSNCVRSRTATCIYENVSSTNPCVSQVQQTVPDLGHYSKHSIPFDGRSDTSRSNLHSNLSSPQIDVILPADASQHLLTHDPESSNLKLRIQELEDQLSKIKFGLVQSPLEAPRLEIETTASRIGGTYHLHCEKSPMQNEIIARGITHKSRLFGQSHWEVNVILMIRDILGKIESHLCHTSPEGWPGIERCKSLARIIKARRAPPWPSPPTLELPAKEVSDALLDCYLRSSESVYRILHIPTFKRDYEAFWTLKNAPDVAFLMQIKLVLAIGALTYDDRFSLRKSAIHWVYEAQTWLSEPRFKSRLNISFLQTHLLLLIAQEQVGAGGDSMWISIGGLLRKAIHLGFHRDPVHLPNRTFLAAEMRRRLWNTILEFALQSSLSSGGPPLISLDDFDTAIPGNFDDDQLVVDNPVAEAEEHFTQVSIAIALRKTFPIRLAIVKFLNDLPASGTYEEILQLDKQFRTAYKALKRTLQACNGQYPSTTASPLQFEMRFVDLIMHRYLSSLHLPYFSPALHQAAYAFSRKVVVDASLKIWRLLNPPPSPISITSTTGPAAASSQQAPDILARLSTLSAGFFPIVSIHASLLIMIELQAQLREEEESLGPTSLRPDLLCVLEEAKTSTLRAIEAGETSIKGFLIMCIMTAQIEGLMNGLGDHELAEGLTKAAEYSVEKCLPILEEMAAAQNIDAVGDEHSQDMQLDTLSDMKDWSFLTPDALFNFDDDPMNWVLKDGMNPAPSLW